VLPRSDRYLPIFYFHGNRYGLLASGTQNFIVKNTASTNPGANYSIVANNDAAPVILDPGGNAFGTMSPWSNVAH
jgi:hypothetical protein